MIRTRHARQIRAGIEIAHRDLKDPLGDPSVEDIRTLGRYRLARRAWERVWVGYFRGQIKQLTERLRKDATS